MSNDTDNLNGWWNLHDNLSFLLEYLKGPHNTTDITLDLNVAMDIVATPWRYTEEYRTALDQYHAETGDDEAVVVWQEPDTNTEDSLTDPSFRIDGKFYKNEEFTFDHAWQWVNKHMPVEAAKALIKFTSLNPHWRGANWEDVLETLCDSDSHLEITEAMHVALWNRYPFRLVQCITLTAIYADPGFTQTFNDAERAMVVAATIDQ